MKLEAHGDRVLAKAISAEHNIGGLIISDASTNLKKAEVIKVGNGLNGNKIPFGPGDIIYYKDKTGFEIMFEGLEYVVLRESDAFFYEKI